MVISSEKAEICHDYLITKCGNSISLGILTYFAKKIVTKCDSTGCYYKVREALQGVKEFVTNTSGIIYTRFTGYLAYTRQYMEINDEERSDSELITYEVLQKFILEPLFHFTCLYIV